MVGICQVSSTNEAGWMHKGSTCQSKSVQITVSFTSLSFSFRDLHFNVLQDTAQVADQRKNKQKMTEKGTI